MAQSVTAYNYKNGFELRYLCNSCFSYNISPYAFNSFASLTENFNIVNDFCPVCGAPITSDISLIPRPFFNSSWNSLLPSRRYSNLWCHAVPTAPHYNLFSCFGNNSFLNFIHETGIFRIEVEISAVTSFTYQAIIANRDGYKRGFVVSTVNNRIYFSLTNGTALVVSFYTPVLSTSNYFVVYGIGTGVYYSFNGSLSSFIPFTKPLGVGNAQLSLWFGNSVSSTFRSNFRNIKIFSSSDASIPVCIFPLFDSNSILKDFISGVSAHKYGDGFYEVVSFP